MSTRSFRGGWLLASFPLDGRTGLLAGSVLDWQIDVRRDRLPAGALRAATADVTATFTLAGDAEIRSGATDEGMLEILQKSPDKAAGRAWLAEMKALLELARRHPEEYAGLREGEAVIRALGG